VLDRLLAALGHDTSELIDEAAVGDDERGGSV
jgi:hypothetical protein